MKALTRTLFRAARVSATVYSLRDPRHAARRVKNVVVGRALGRIGFWRWIWGGSR